MSDINWWLIGFEVILGSALICVIIGQTIYIGSGKLDDEYGRYEFDDSIIFNDKDIESAEGKTQICGCVEPVFYKKWRSRICQFFRKKDQSRYELHAFRELKALGYKSLDEEEDGPNKWIQENILELLKTFASQGHSGSSAPYCITLFSKLARFEPLCPLTGLDEEWNEVSDFGASEGGKVYQNNRCSHVFKEGGKAYDIDAVVYEHPNGCRFTKGGERHFIEFPYTPTVKVVMVDYDGNEIKSDDLPIFNDESEK